MKFKYIAIVISSGEIAMRFETEKECREYIERVNKFQGREMLKMVIK